ncbi:MULTISPECIES: HIT family protein [Bacillaceae]|uniref:HIT domain-containing protein n=1 Tax=Alkalicoccobacillus plakortidis TaxID=444060 RepID=A0A9D5DPQ9_9BACI|nr:MULTISPECIES: hypothetical protein [Bacillaceae]KQL56806.1 hypothetical protein AN965_11925 [Alkalicoccobacillus plakortidis]
MDHWKQNRIKAAQQQQNPMAMARMRTGFAVIGDTQFLPGYCVLLPDEEYPSLEALPYQKRSDYLLDMSLIGDAILHVCKPIRVNYSIYGNTDPFLHAHIFPRYSWEPEERIPYPVWQYPKQNWTDENEQFQENKHGGLRAELTKHLHILMKDAY